MRAWGSPNKTVPTRPTGTGDNSAASTNFVLNQIATTSVTGLAAIADKSFVGNNSGGLASPAVITASLSWSPLLQFGGTTTGITYSAGPTGHYTRIGPLVIGDANFVLSSKGSATGAAAITGLPFANGAADSSAIFVAFYANMASIVAASGYIASATTTMNLANGGAVTMANMLDTNFTNTTQLYVTFFYIAV